MASKKLPPVHPGEILLLDFLEPLEISQYRLAKDISVPPGALTKLSKGHDLLPQTLRYGSQNISGPPIGFGSTFNRTTSWNLSGTDSENA